jgi:DNA-binding SARP family transcriptional activator
MNKLRLYLFGSPHIEYREATLKIERRKAFALVAYLALTPQPISRAFAAALLWPNLDESHARSALRSTLRSLQCHTAETWLSATRTTIGLMRDALWVDVWDFERAVAGQQGSPDDEHAHDVQLKLAVETYSADFLAGFFLTDCPEFEEWQLQQAEWLRREYADALRRLSEHYARRAQTDDAIRYARLWLAADPLHEPAHRHLMSLYAHAGQRSEALRQYQLCVDLLDRELATPPERATSELFKVIQMEKMPALPGVEGESTSTFGILPPLPPLVIGRDVALTELKAHLGLGSSSMRPCTLMQGWPGVGKSTLVAQIAHDRDIGREFPDGVLWASLGESADLSGTIESWAAVFNLGDRTQMRKIEDTSALLTAFLREKRVLIILDDVWRADHVTPFRVGGHQSALLITSRLNDVVMTLAPTPGDIYRLRPLSDIAALELLGTLTPETVANHADAALELVRDLEGLPLAISVAGRLLHAEAHLGFNVLDLLGDLREGANLLHAPAPADMKSVGQETTPTVAALLLRSTNTLDALTRERFALLSLFVPKPASFDLQAMAVVWNVQDARPTVRILINRGLIEPINGGRFQMHALLVLHARALLQEMSAS